MVCQTCTYYTTEAFLWDFVHRHLRTRFSPALLGVWDCFNHLNTSFNTHTPVRAFRTGVFCCSKNFLKKIRKSSAFFSKGSIAPRKGESTTNFPTRKGGENVEPNRREFIKQCAFQKFCNTVLHNEACDAHKELHRHKAREITFPADG